MAPPTRPWWPATKIRSPSFMVVEGAVAPLPDQHVALGQPQVLGHHLRHEFGERRPRSPAQLPPGLARIAAQGVDLGGTVIARVDADDHPSAIGVDAHLL